MSIENQESPSAALDAVRKVLVALAADARAFRTPNLRRADPTSIQLTTPHRSAELPLSSLAGDRPVAVILRGWRFIVTDKDRQPLAAAESVQAGMGEYRFAELNEGPYVRATAEALRRAENLEGVADGQFEPLLLVVPALRIAALWLKRVNGPAEAIDPADLLLPLPPVDESFVPFESLPADRFLTVLRHLAERVPQDSSRGG